MQGDPAEATAVAVVRRAFEAFDRRDLDALVELTDPEVELFAPTAALANEGRCYRGHDGIGRYLQDVERTWARLRVMPERFREVGNHVVCVGQVQAEARDGFAVDRPTAWVWELRGRKLLWGCVYANPGSTFMGLSFETGEESRKESRKEGRKESRKAADGDTPAPDPVLTEASQPVRAA